MNVLIIVFDALSASNVPLFGYRRNTTPKLLEIAKQAIVYHRHYAGGNYTTPGTASLLTGTYPWTHRAIKLGDGVVKNRAIHNIFNVFPNHQRFAYTHNYNVDHLLYQFQNDIEEKENLWELFLASGRVISQLFSKDIDAVSIVEGAVFDTSNPSTYSLLLSRFVKEIIDKRSLKVTKDYEDLFPRGLPSFKEKTWEFFILENAIDWLTNQIEGCKHPFLGYIHLLPPHDPYRTRKEFIDIFNDGWKPDEKPGFFAPDKFYSNGRANEARRWYDEYILYVDSEFHRLFNYLQKSGELENTILIFTSDHGEMFERGIIGHDTLSMHQPVIHIPLVILHPDQKEGIDVISPTSTVDLLPTLLYLNGQPIPEWCQGEVLPPFKAKVPKTERSIYALEAKKNPKSTSPLTRASGMIVHGRYKLTKYYGYDELPSGEPLIELFDYENDPEELENLYPEKRTTANDLLNELEKQIEEADRPYL
ncbi:MAG: sulfatase-like hydrolase/transferase [Anaerolineales bacterium]